MHQIFIDGAWIDAREGPALGITNPATLEPLGAVPACGREDVARAVAAARAALEPWRSTTAAARTRLLADIGGRIRANAADLAMLLTRESGKPLRESRDCLETVAAIFERAPMLGDSSDGFPPPAVIACLVPFNFPLLIAAGAAVPALAAGNTVVCKPPREDPLASLKLAQLCESLPRGALNIITGGADTELALIEQADVVSFTGSAESGRRIESVAHGKRLDLHARSVGACIVCKDADLEVAVPAIAWRRLVNTGQGCSSDQHVYVERTIRDELIARLHSYVGFLEVDNPIKTTTDLGPIVSLQAARRVEDQVGRLLREGARLILGGRGFRPSGLAGHFFQPTILADIHPGGLASREEILGPVLAVTAVSDFAQALRSACESHAKGEISIYTRDSDAVVSLLECAKAGTFRINDPTSGQGPFAGVLRGPIRRALALPGSLQTERVEVAPALLPKPWWFPYADRR